MKTAAQLLTRKGPAFNTVTPDTPALKAVHQMSCSNCNFVVVKTGDMYLGILTEADYTRKVVIREKDASQLEAKDIMNSNLPIVNIDDSVERCMQLMQQFAVHYLPVFDEMDFKGIVTADDIIREALLSHEEIFDQQTVS